MPPNTPPPAPQANYDFILNHGQAPKKSLLPGTGSSTKQRILFVAIAGGILLIIIIMVASLLFGGKGNSPGLLKVAQTQAELARISALGNEKVSSSSAKAFATTTNLSVISAQKNVLAQLKKQGVKTNPKLLGISKNTKTDAALNAAAQDNRYDETFKKIMAGALSEYQKELKAAFNETANNSIKQMLNGEYTGAGLLITMSKT